MSVIGQVERVEMTDHPSSHTHHLGGASEADVSAADVEMAAMASKPSNIIVGAMAALLGVACACAIASSSTDEWAVSNLGGIWGGTHTGLFQTCTISTSTSSTTAAMKICFDDEEGIKPPYRVRTCRRHGRAASDKPWEVTYKEELLRTSASQQVKKSITCNEIDPDMPATTPTPYPTAALPALGPSGENDYTKLLLLDNKEEQGEVIKQLTAMATFSIISNIAHVICLIGAVTVAFISFFHNCCPTGKCPPVLPVVAVLVTMSCVVITAIIQLFLVSFWVLWPGKFYIESGMNSGVSYDLATWALVLDVLAVCTYALRIEMRFRTCCAGRDHCCAKA